MGPEEPHISCIPVGTCFDTCWQHRMSSFGISSSAALSSVESQGGESSTWSGDEHKNDIAHSRDMSCVLCSVTLSVTECKWWSFQGLNYSYAQKHCGWEWQPTNMLQQGFCLCIVWHKKFSLFLYWWWWLTCGGQPGIRGSMRILVGTNLSMS